MKVGAIQSSYIPWRGYFDFIRSVDLFVFLDDVQYTQRDWRNRNRIKTAAGPRWLSVPVKYSHSCPPRIADAVIENAPCWVDEHCRKFRAHYRAAPFLETALALLDPGKLPGGTTISTLNVYLTRRICTYFGITTPTILSTELQLEGKKTERLIEMLKKLGATSYLSGPAADAYLDKNRFRDENICLEYKTYAYDSYPQLWGAFEGGVTILDLIANCGPEAGHHLKSATSNARII